MIDQPLQRINQRLIQSLDRDVLVQKTVHELRNTLGVDRVVLYYFYRRWEGQVTFEALSSQQFSILGSTGPDECFNGEYAAWYEQGRIRAIKDLENEPISPCHRDFLRDLQVRANLAVPIVNRQGLWGLLIAHHCRDTKQWLPSHVESMKHAATILEKTPNISGKTIEQKC